MSKFFDFAVLWGCRSIINVNGTKKEMYNLFNLDRMSKRDQDTTWDALWGIIPSVYRRDPNDQWFADAVKHRMFHSDVLSVCFDEQNEPVSLMASDSVKTHYGRVLYGAMTGTRNDCQRQGWMKGMKEALVGNCHFITGRTQNPVVLRATAMQFGSIAPIDGIDAESLFVAKYLASLHASEMDDNFVCRGVYNGRPLYDQPFWTGDRYSEFLAGAINASKGDAIMFVARNKKAYVKYAKAA